VQRGDPAIALAIYRGNARANRIGALTDGYPVVAQLVGPDFFGWMARRYADETPSRSANLEEYGHDFHCFVAAFDPAASLPYLADVARFERTIEDVFVAIDDPAEPVSPIAALAPPSRRQLRLDARARLFESRWPVARIWEVNQPNADDDTVDLHEPGTRVLIRRDGLSVLIEPIGIGEWAMLDAIRRGRSLLQAIEAALCADPQFNAGKVVRARCRQHLFRLESTQPTQSTRPEFRI